MVVRYSSANVGLSRLIVSPNQRFNLIHMKVKRPPLLRLNRQIILNRQYFVKYPGNFKGIKHSIKVNFSSRRLFETSQQDPRHRRARFVKWWTITSIPLVFFGVFARIQYTRNTDEEEDVRPKSWKFFCYQTLPLNAISRLWGRFNSIDLPVWAREPGYKLYSYLFGVNLEEMKQPDLKLYRNLGEFFYRELKESAREISDSELVSPSDGTVLSLGTINANGEIQQVKGMNYSVSKFLGINNQSPYQQIEPEEYNDNTHEEFAQINGISYTVDDLLGVNPTRATHHFLHDINYHSSGEQAKQPKDKQGMVEVVNELNEPAKKGNQLFYSVIYLAPGDYHRFHSPANWVAQVRRYFTGELFSVAPYFQKTLSNLFILNERVSILGYWKHGFFSMTPVGATNVGSIKINFDKELTTNQIYDSQGVKFKKNSCYQATYSKSSKILNGYPLNKGMEMGGFQLGSTVVLVFEAPLDFHFNVSTGPIKMGQSLGACKHI